MRQVDSRSTTYWYVVRTKRAHEQTAAEHLRRQGYNVYSPRLGVSSLRRGQRYERVVPLFPRYIFVSLLEGEQALAPIRSTVGVSSIVGFGARFARVPHQVVCGLQAREDSETGLHSMRLHRLPRRGSSVRVTAGPLDGLEGIFECECGADRVVVLLDLLGRSTRVQMPVNSLLAVSSSAA